jgi:hypothetical protein
MDLARLLSSSLAPVQANILVYLGPKEFLALSAVSKGVYVGLKEGLRATCCNIAIKLKKFFSDPKAFRKVQAASGVLIADIEGSFVRKFFANEDTPNELHLYVECSIQAALRNYIISAGYTEVSVET